MSRNFFCCRGMSMFVLVIHCNTLYAWDASQALVLLIILWGPGCFHVQLAKAKTLQTHSCEFLVTVSTQGFAALWCLHETTRTCSTGIWSSMLLIHVFQDVYCIISYFQDTLYNYLWLLWLVNISYYIKYYYTAWLHCCVFESWLNKSSQHILLSSLVWFQTLSGVG